MAPRSPLVSTHFTLREVLRLVPVTGRQLQWWDERGIVRPVQDSHCRFYSAEQLFQILMIRELLERCFTLRRARKILTQFERQNIATGWLLTNGERVLVLQSAPELVAFLEQRRVPLFVIVPLAPLHSRIAEAQQKLHKLDGALDLPRPLMERIIARPTVAREGSIKLKPAARTYRPLTDVLAERRAQWA